MFFYKIKSTSNVVYEGLSSKREELDYLLKRKIELSNFKGHVEIYDGKKLIEEYDIS